VQVGVPKQNHQNPQQLVLASASPRRLDLLGQIHIIPDQILPADSDETPHHHERPNDYALRMACEKALLVAKRLAAARAVPLFWLVIQWWRLGGGFCQRPKPNSRRVIACQFCRAGDTVSMAGLRYVCLMAVFVIGW
jgi:hypothetical protein